MNTPGPHPPQPRISGYLAALHNTLGVLLSAFQVICGAGAVFVVLAIQYIDFCLGWLASPGGSSRPTSAFFSHPGGRVAITEDWELRQRSDRSGLNRSPSSLEDCG